VSSNLDLVKSIFDAWEEGDFTSTDWADPEIDFVMRGGLNRGTWKGVEGMAEGWATMLNAWENLHAVPEGFRATDDGRILVFVRNEGRGRGSGIQIDGISTHGANVFTVRDGKVTRLELYWDRDEAIAELGLSEGT
jgi:ketosteroid isomerase-like protein